MINDNITVKLKVEGKILDTDVIDSKDINLTVANKYYFGALDENVDISANDITTLTSSYLSESLIECAIACGQGQYAYLAYPAKYGETHIYMNGFEGGFILHSKISIQNTYGHTEIYNIYRSEHTDLGTIKIYTDNINR